ncbi:ferric reductase [Streptomyces noursei ZPM]|uniref:Ferric reductase n=1 Tax=Streptomyces noursei TaxID=1971 RepID=A0A401QVI0_STRNR|nr:ferredoxin reductase family protein [Streptomyces noursei]AKA02130.1 ferric reductase [Streptomyces noursei ZPM]EOS97912.1 ferric reductase [Streptomyces noursei CCRC 11814]EXU91723.1 ferric reductase [Streptomyces noursei PD-1]GCB89350.1 ferric reductase [Streptomyces noursei]
MSTLSHSHRSARGGAPPRRPPAPAPLLVQAVIGAGALGVLALWWTGTASVVGPAGWLTGAGRITGLLAGYACAVLVALMARVPLLDHALGTDRLARWHAAAGRYTVSLVLTHVLLIVWGYTLTSRSGVLHEATTLVLDYPDMLKATVGCVLLLGTGLVSARAARRRMSYETWHYLHFATYLALFLAFGHQLANGADFVGRRPAQLGWYALYGAVAVLLVWYRFAVPVRRALRHRLRVVDVRPEAPGVVSVHLAGERLTELGARPGQFFRWRFLAPGLWWTANPYSLSAPPLPQHLRITVKAAGGHSAALARLRPGTRVWAEGPYGAFTEARRRAPKVLLLAGGVGITPLRTLFETLPGEVTLVYRARRPEDLALRAELDAIAAARGAAVHYCVDEPAAYAVPLTARALRQLVPDLAAHEVYLCGPPGMTDAARRALRGAGVPRHHIHHESFAF